jgi:hypothetical protein
VIIPELQDENKQFQYIDNIWAHDGTSRDPLKWGGLVKIRKVAEQFIVPQSDRSVVGRLGEKYEGRGTILT